MRETVTIAALLLSICSAGAQNGFRYEIPYPAPLERSDSVKLVVMGDVMMHSRQLEYDCSPFLSELKPIIEGADFALANMEFSLGGEPYSGYPAFSAPDNYASYVQALGVDVFLTANNHILDRGRKGLERTLEVYDRLGVMHCGSARDSLELKSRNPLILRAKGISIALLNFTYGTNNPGSGAFPSVNLMDRKSVSEAIVRAREKGADFILALPHWGTEYSLRHDAGQEDWAKWLVEQGVDAIVGSHPHVVQDSCHIDGRPVIYSLGNAVSNMSAKNTRLGLVVELTFVKKECGECTVREPSLNFTWCTLPGTLTDNYMTIDIKKWATRRSEWLTDSDYLNMVSTLKRVAEATSIVWPIEN